VDEVVAPHQRDRRVEADEAAPVHEAQDECADGEARHPEREFPSRPPQAGDPI
jgi:hypothetical protein